MNTKQRNTLPQWTDLENHADEMRGVSISDLFKNDPNRFEGFSLSCENMLLDYSKNNITQDTTKKLIALAKACDLEGTRDAMFAGEILNTTENRAVLHTALRAQNDAPVYVGGEDIIPDIRAAQDKMRSFSDNVIRNRTYTDIVNIGIGGSDLGPNMVYDALKPYSNRDINLHFVSNVDAAHLQEVLRSINPEKTLVIVTSKSFTTQETMTNAWSARKWLHETLGKSVINDHFVAVTQNVEAAEEFGVDEDHIFPMWDWVGGRFSLWSAVGLCLCITLGYENYAALLRGANAMDEHFKTAPLANNLPATLGLIGVWHRNFMKRDVISIAPYNQYLNRLTCYMQQLDMESNGKSVDREGRSIDYDTGPSVIGETGTNAQHAFFQLLHQGTDIIPCDFIVTAKSHEPMGDHQTKLLANVLAQSKALMEGKQHQDPHHAFSGNRPSNTIVLDALTPYTLGMLLALYEHKIFVQGVIWNINSFDQCGVELGKVLAKQIISDINDNAEQDRQDSSTAGLLNHIRNIS